MIHWGQDVGYIIWQTFYVVGLQLGELWLEIVNIRLHYHEKINSENFYIRKFEVFLYFKIFRFSMPNLWVNAVWDLEAWWENGHVAPAFFSFKAWFALPDTKHVVLIIRQEAWVSMAAFPPLSSLITSLQNISPKITAKGLCLCVPHNQSAEFKIENTRMKVFFPFK